MCNKYRESSAIFSYMSAETINIEKYIKTRIRRIRKTKLIPTEMKNTFWRKDYESVSVEKYGQQLEIHIIHIKALKTLYPKVQ